MNKYTEKLFALSDENCRLFNIKLIPNIEKETIIGVRIPLIRKYAGELIKSGEYTDFIKILPHTYYEEYQLHAAIVSLIKDYDTVIEMTEKLLPYIDNWAVCDSFNPKCFSKNKDKLIERIYVWVKSEHIYTKRFAVDMLMGHFLDDDFSAEHLSLVSALNCDEYYLNMAVAWYFATALSKQYDETVRFLENDVLNKFTHNKTIQKAVESYRISEEKKKYLKTLKRK